MEGIEALSNLINQAEGQMLASRKTYEAAIAARNNTGELKGQELAGICSAVLPNSTVCSYGPAAGR